jgi:histidyl-tRNA synthetase
VGLGWGDVTMRNFLETHGLLPKMTAEIDALVTLPRAELRATAEKITRELRAAGLKAITPLTVEGFGTQLKLASKHGARAAILLGDAELAEGKVAVKDLVSGKQETVALAEVAKFVTRLRDGA